MADPNDPWNQPPSGAWGPPAGPPGPPASPGQQDPWTRSDPWAAPPPPGAWWQGPPGEPGAIPPGTPVSPAAAPPEPRRGTLLIALAFVAILAGSALFASGFTLGLQQALAPGTPSGERDLFDPFWEAYRKITTEYVGQIEPKDLVEGAIGGMFDAVDDPYSGYMTSQEYEDSLGGISGEFEGIGAEMTSETPDGLPCGILGDGCALLVVDVLRDSPAESSGLLPGDELVSVDGTAVAGSTLEEVVARVKGPRGTEVVLGLERGGAPVELTIVRDVVRTEDVRAELLADGTVGYLDIEGFSGSAAQDFRDLLKEQLDGGVRRFIIDVRDDPGGFVDAALSIASEFIASGPVYWEEYADGQQVPTDAQGDGLATDPGIEVAVLINGGSASASEILAGALQDTGRATLVGQRSFGKGTIQQWHLLSNQSGGFRLSVAKWLTPDKRWIHGEGLEPDVQVGDSSPGTGADPQLERAVELLSALPTAPGAPSPAAAVPRALPPLSAWPLRIGIEGSMRHLS